MVPKNIYMKRRFGPRATEQIMTYSFLQLAERPSSHLSCNSFCASFSITTSSCLGSSPRLPPGGWDDTRQSAAVPRLAHWWRNTNRGTELHTSLHRCNHDSVANAISIPCWQILKYSWNHYFFFFKATIKGREKGTLIQFNSIIFKQYVMDLQSAIA